MVYLRISPKILSTGFRITSNPPTKFHENWSTTFSVIKLTEFNRQTNQ